MKNFYSTVKKSGPLKSRTQLSIDKNMVDSQGMLTLWNLMETMNSIKEKRIQSLLLNDRYEESVKTIDLKLYRNASLGDDLMVESNFVPMGKRQVNLKVYVSNRIKGEPSRRVCKAVYTLSIQPK
ncbi:MAG: hypothetical protein CMP53_07365 [Flavobacteriales bacterium]|jgi:hypothetical protein|nr:hypothetical protein [Flavobacteriales bacterium]|tara:strand:+ start:795 stop:1169 length:375 start_codon:yes stop_codon:yes gene_type:complete